MIWNVNLVLHSVNLIYIVIEQFLALSPQSLSQHRVREVLWIHAPPPHEHLVTLLPVVLWMVGHDSFNVRFLESEPSGNKLPVHHFLCEPHDHLLAAFLLR